MDVNKLGNTGISVAAFLDPATIFFARYRRRSRLGCHRHRSPYGMAPKWKSYSFHWHLRQPAALRVFRYEVPAVYTILSVRMEFPSTPAILHFENPNLV
ncbi:hypothetical protein D3C80_826720 [compost metagenome]